MVRFGPSGLAPPKLCEGLAHSVFGSLPKRLGQCAIHVRIEDVGMNVTFPAHGGRVPQVRRHRLDHHRLRYDAAGWCALPAHARHRAPVGARVRHGDGRSAHGFGSPRLGFVFDQSAMVLAVDPSSVFGIGASGTYRY